MNKDLFKLIIKSHPSWVRGLKLLTSLFLRFVTVAPLVGAWIETAQKSANKQNYKVAPLVGAWIETSSASVQIRGKTSHPSWVRGLKHLIKQLCLTLSKVAPLVGAWIETWP